MMTATELFQDIEPIVKAHTGDIPNLVAVIRPNSERVIISAGSYSLPGYFIEAISSYCHANFIPWIMAYDVKKKEIYLDLN